MIGHLPSLIRNAFKGPIDLFSVGEDSARQSTATDSNKAPSPLSLASRRRHFSQTIMKELVHLIFGRIVGELAEAHSAWVSEETAALRTLMAHEDSETQLKTPETQDKAHSPAISLLSLLNVFKTDLPSISSLEISPSKLTIPYLVHSAREERANLIDILAAVFENGSALYELMFESESAIALEYLQMLYVTTNEGRHLFDLIHHESVQSIIDFYSPVCDCLRLLNDMAAHLLGCPTIDAGHLLRRWLSNTRTTHYDAGLLESTSSLEQKQPFQEPMFLNDLTALFDQLDDRHLDETSPMSGDQDGDIRLLWLSKLSLLRALVLRLTFRILDAAPPMRSLYIATNGCETLLHVVYSSLETTEKTLNRFYSEMEQSIHVPEDHLEEIQRNLQVLPFLDKTADQCLDSLVRLSLDTQGATYMQETSEVCRATIDLASRIICAYHEVTRWIRNLNERRSFQATSQECLIAFVSHPADEIAETSPNDTTLTKAIVLLRQAIAWRRGAVSLPQYSQFFDKVIAEYSNGRLVASLVLLLSRFCLVRDRRRLSASEEDLAFAAADMLAQCLSASSFTDNIQDAVIVDLLTQSSVECFSYADGNRSPFVTCSVFNLLLWTVVNAGPCLSQVLIEALHLAGLYNDALRRKVLACLLGTVNDYLPETPSADDITHAQGERKLLIDSWGTQCLRKLGTAISIDSKSLSAQMEAETESEIKTPTNKGEESSEQDAPLSFFSLLQATVLSGNPSNSEVRAALCQIKLIAPAQNVAPSLTLLSGVLSWVSRGRHRPASELIQPLLLLCCWSSCSRYLRPLDRHFSDGRHTAHEMRKLRRAPLGVWENLYFEKAFFLSSTGVEFLELLIEWGTREVSEVPSEDLQRNLSAFFVVGVVGRAVQLTELMELNPANEVYEVFSPDELQLFSSALSQALSLVPSAKVSKLINGAGDLQKLLVGSKTILIGVPSSLGSVIERLTDLAEGSVATTTPSNILAQGSSTFGSCIHYPDHQQLLISPFIVSYLKIRSTSFQQLTQSFAFSMNPSLDHFVQAAPVKGATNTHGTSAELSAVMQAIGTLSDKLNSLTQIKETGVLSGNAPRESGELPPQVFESLPEIEGELADLNREELVSIIGFLALQLQQESSAQPVELCPTLTQEEAEPRFIESHARKAKTAQTSTVEISPVETQSIGIQSEKILSIEAQQKLSECEQSRQTQFEEKGVETEEAPLNNTGDIKRMNLRPQCIESVSIVQDAKPRSSFICSHPEMYIQPSRGLLPTLSLTRVVSISIEPVETPSRQWITQEPLQVYEPPATRKLLTSEPLQLVSIEKAAPKASHVCAQEETQILAQQQQARLSPGLLFSADASPRVRSVRSQSVIEAGAAKECEQARVNAKGRFLRTQSCERDSSRFQTNKMVTFAPIELFDWATSRPLTVSSEDSRQESLELEPQLLAKVSESVAGAMEHKSPKLGPQRGSKVPASEEGALELVETHKPPELEPQRVATMTASIAGAMERLEPRNSPELEPQRTAKMVVSVAGAMERLVSPTGVLERVVSLIKPPWATSGENSRFEMMDLNLESPVPAAVEGGSSPDPIDESQVLVGDEIPASLYSVRPDDPLHVGPPPMDVWSPELLISAKPENPTLEIPPEYLQSCALSPNPDHPQPPNMHTGSHLDMIAEEATLSPPCTFTDEPGAESHSLTFEPHPSRSHSQFPIAHYNNIQTSSHHHYLESPRLQDYWLPAGQGSPLSSSQLIEGQSTIYELPPSGSNLTDSIHASYQGPSPELSMLEVPYQWDPLPHTVDSIGPATARKMDEGANMPWVDETTAPDSAPAQENPPSPLPPELEQFLASEPATAEPPWRPTDLTLQQLPSPQNSLFVDSLVSLNPTDGESNTSSASDSIDEILNEWEQTL
eukprot:Gregarina_sp_Poly_1__1226@NODE_12_length_23383_cov_104_521445_g10_i0_p1_GENE_NODE_12_length_23383_cov_104_521445_g10_i0NODE_12_length_23383_cov_104_521445_g10_i0_p1_ORF_typecomplete_len2026_score304_83_NODE_12_length_23383_cov_104_521445_g10_i04046079